MKLLIFFDHRFMVDKQGRIGSTKHYDSAFYEQRYGEAFDEIRIVARNATQTSDRLVERGVVGGSVSFVKLGDWNGVSGFLRARKRLERILKDELSSDAAIILVVPGAIGTHLQPILAKSGRPHALEVVGDPYDSLARGANRHPLRPLLRRSATKNLEKQCQTATAVSYVTAGALQRRYPTSHFSVGISDVVLQEDAIAASSRMWPRDLQMPQLIMVGTLAQLYKAPDVLLEAFRLVVESGKKACLTFVGDGRYRQMLQERANELGLAEKVQFKGNVDSGTAVRAELDRADLFVLASRQEGLPRAMVEAMARGLPCIGSKVGGIPELLQPEELVTPGDPKELASKIIEVLADPRRLERMSERNLIQARKFTDVILQRKRNEFYFHLKGVTEDWIRKGRG